VSEPMCFGEMVQELTHLRAQYEQFIIDRERERITKLLEPEITRHYNLGLDASAAYLEQTIALIKGEQK